jgi:hypothetical protein
MRLRRAFTHRAGGDLPRKPLEGAYRTGGRSTPATRPRLRRYVVTGYTSPDRGKWVAGVGLPGNARHFEVLATAARPQQSIHVTTESVFATNNHAERRCAYAERPRTALGAICRGSPWKVPTELGGRSTPATRPELGLSVLVDGKITRGVDTHTCPRSGRRRERFDRDGSVICDSVITPVGALDRLICGPLENNSAEHAIVVHIRGILLKPIVNHREDLQWLVCPGRKTKCTAHLSVGEDSDDLAPGINTGKTRRVVPVSIILDLRDEIAEKIVANVHANGLVSEIPDCQQAFRRGGVIRGRSAVELGTPEPAARRPSRGGQAGAGELAAWSWHSPAGFSLSPPQRGNNTPARSGSALVAGFQTGSFVIRVSSIPRSLFLSRHTVSAPRGQQHASPVGRAVRAPRTVAIIDDSPGPGPRRPGKPVTSTEAALKGQDNGRCPTRRGTRNDGSAPPAPRSLLRPPLVPPLQGSLRSARPFPRGGASRPRKTDGATSPHAGPRRSAPG